jgi:hypothetical protein
LTFLHHFWNGAFSRVSKSSTCDRFQWYVPKEMIGGIDTRRVQQLQIWQIERELADASATVHCLRFMLKTSLLSCTACNSVLFGVQMTCLCSNMQPSDKAQIFFGTKCRKLLFPGVIKLQPMFYNKVHIVWSAYWIHSSTFSSQSGIACYVFFFKLSYWNLNVSIRYEYLFFFLVCLVINSFMNC